MTSLTPADQYVSVCVCVCVKVLHVYMMRWRSLQATTVIFGVYTVLVGVLCVTTPSTSAEYQVT